MIRPPWDGAAFSDAKDGDIRGDLSARRRWAGRLGITEEWATVRQVHGTGVMRVSSPGEAGDADALWTTVGGLPLAVFTADCLGVIVRATDAIGVAHGGWRGLAGGVVWLLSAKPSQ